MKKIFRPRINRSKKICTVVLFLLSFALFQAQVKLDENSILIENISYKTIEKGDTNRVLLDIYMPKNPVKKVPVLVQIHGGAWVEGNKSLTGRTFSEMAVEQLLKLGYAVVSINYRLVNKEIHFPIPIQDCKDAIRWIRKNAEKYQFDTENIGVWGGSAGAHLSLLAAYTDDAKFIGDPDLAHYSAKVNYVLDEFGPVDMNAILQTKAGKFKLFLARLLKKDLISLRARLINAITGMDINTQKKEIIALCDDISPIHYTETAVPTMIWHGNKDNVVPLKQSKLLLKKLKENHVDAALHVIDGGDHGFTKSTESVHAEIAKQMVDFVVKNTQ